MGEEIFGGDGYVYGIDRGDGFMGMLISKIIKLYMLNIYSFLYINHTSIKWLKKSIDTGDFSESYVVIKYSDARCEYNF